MTEKCHIPRCDKKATRRFKSKGNHIDKWYYYCDKHEGLSVDNSTEQSLEEADTE